MKTDIREVMTYKNGSFYRSGEKVPIEFGNKDQLALMRKAEALKDGVIAFLDESGDDDSTIIRYTCMCGTCFEKQYTYTEWNEFKKDKFTCLGCGIKYLLDGEQHDPTVIVKFDKTKP
jgi:hypothetical protein